MTPTLFDLAEADLAGLLADQPSYRCEQVWRGLYESLRLPDELTNVPKSLRADLAEKAPLALREVQRQSADNATTIKWLWELIDGHQVETVLMLYPDRATVCVSSQAGCAMACSFCATGQAGFDRHLTTGEIVEQVVRAAREARAQDRRVSNVVFMGMGEPLANVAPTLDAIDRFRNGLGMSARSITVSTVGLIPGIRRLAEAALPVTLAVSLHAANDELRNELVPINRRYPLSDLADAVADYRDRTGRRVSFEWALIHDVNDSDRDADQFAAIARSARAHINLIPLNPTPGYPVRGAPPSRLRSFRDRLEAKGANATIRRTRGVEIDAACGQLAARARQGEQSVTVAAPRRR